MRSENRYDIESQFDTPIVLFFFNRPEKLRLVWEQVRRQKPLRLYLIQDGARDSDDLPLMEQCRDLIQIDFPSEVTRIYRPTNLGSTRSIQNGLDTVFSEQKLAVILEDDCVPNDTFFKWMSVALAQNAGNRSVGMVSGTNYSRFTGLLFGQGYLSKFAHVWGWGTWADRWELYEHSGSSWYEETDRDILKAFSLKIYRQAWEWNFNSMNTLHTWDFQLTYMLLKRRMFSVVPKSNLVLNIGFGEGAERTKNPRNHFQKKPRSLALGDKLLIHGKLATSFFDFVELVNGRWFSLQNILLDLWAKAARGFEKLFN